MTYRQFAFAASEVGAYSDRDAYVSDLALSSAFADCGDDASAALIADLVKIWDASHMSIRDLRALTGLSQVRFAERFLIPRRTLENWESGTAECPVYTRMMLADILGCLPERSN